MFATAATLAVMGFAIRALTNLARQDGAKVLEALQGRSRLAQPRPDRPMVVCLSSRPEAPAWRPELRAAA